MLAYNEVKERKYIVLDGDPYEVLDSHVFRKQQRKPVNQTKLRNLLNGSVRMQTFHQNEVVAEADMTRKKIVFSFKKFDRQSGEEQYWFHEEDDKGKRFSLGASVIESTKNWLKSGQTVDALLFNEQVIGIQVPTIKMDFLVTEAEPAVKGNTATGASKTVTIETGVKINTPLFINQGDTIVVNTDTGQYVERAR